MINDKTLMIEIDLKEKIKNAAKKAIQSLFQNHKESFYYCSLITDGMAHCPIISAWSWEALECEAQKDKNNDEARYYLKWSYADSPYCMYGNEYFSEVAEVFNYRDLNLKTDDERTEEFYIRMNSMEKAMAELDNEGLFGTGTQRIGIVINVEVMPPDYENTLRAIRLNPRDALEDWLEEIAEEAPVETHEEFVDVILKSVPSNGLKDLVTIKRVFSLNLNSKELLLLSHNIPTKLISGIEKNTAIDLIKKSGLSDSFSLESSDI